MAPWTSFPGRIIRALFWRSKLFYNAQDFRQKCPPETDLSHYECWLGFPHQTVISRRTDHLARVFIPGLPSVYLKIYRCPRLKDAWRLWYRGGLFGKSRARIEAENLCFLATRDLAPTLILFREKRNCRFLVWAFLVLEDLVDAEPMDKFVFTRLASLSPVQRQNFIHSLAVATRRMNQGGFVNGEYHWRNILVRQDGDHFDFKVIDCSARRRRDVCFRPYFDLASLDVYAENFFTRSERLRFLKIYLQTDRISSHDRRLLVRILALKNKISRKEWKRYYNVRINLQNKSGEVC